MRFLTPHTPGFFSLVLLTCSASLAFGQEDTSELPPKTLSVEEEDAQKKQTAKKESDKQQKDTSASQDEAAPAPVQADINLPSATALFESQQEDIEEEAEVEQAADQIPSNEVVADAQEVEEEVRKEDTPPPKRITEKVIDQITAPYVETYLKVKDAVASVKMTRSLAPPKEPAFDFSPYVREPKWFEAVALFEEGQCSKAYKLAQAAVGTPKAGAPLAPGLEYGLARMMWCGGKRNEAKEIFNRLAKGEDLALKALANRALGKRVAPVAIIKETPARGLHQSQFSSEIAKAKQYAAKRKTDQALALLEVLEQREGISGSQWYKTRLARVKLLERTGQLEAAARGWRGIHQRTYTWQSAKEIGKMIRAFERRSKLRVIGVAEAMDEMRALVARGRYRQAKQVSVQNAKRAGVKGSELTGWSLYRQALVAERKRNRELADKLFAKAIKVVRHDQVRPKIYFGWARALRRMDRDKEAIALYQRLCQEYPHAELCPSARFEAGRLLQYHDRHDEALAQFFTFMGSYSGHSKMPEATWRAAFSAYLLKRWDQAGSLLAVLERDHGDRKDASELTMGLKARYWQAMIALRQNRRLEAVAKFQRTIDSGPLTWYGRLAASRLEELGHKPNIPIPSDTLALDSPYHLDQLRIPKRYNHWGEAVALSRLGLWKEVTREVGRLSSRGADRHRVKRFMTNLQSVQGRPDLAHWAMKRMIDETGPRWNNLRDWGSAFPLHYIEHVQPWSVKYGVDPFLVQAIIRQESGFRQAVRSHVGAVGLMQLMPGTARYLARVFLKNDKTLRTRRRDLIKPEVNVRLGTMYIRVHQAYAAEHTALALAGYNAGPAPLKRWFERYGERDVDAWVESITYREARGYVRKVMTSYITYAGLYSGRMVQIPLKMPKTLGKWGKFSPQAQASIKSNQVISKR